MQQRQYTGASIHTLKNNLDELQSSQRDEGPAEVLIMPDGEQ